MTRLVGSMYYGGSARGVESRDAAYSNVCARVRPANTAGARVVVQ